MPVVEALGGPSPHYDNQKCLHTLPIIPWEEDAKLNQGGEPLG